MVKQKYEVTLANALNWANKYETVKQWLSGLQRQNKRSRELWLFCNWAGKTPEQLLALKDDRNSLEAEKLLDKFVAEKPYPESMTWLASIATRSFFAYHYKDLAKKAGVFTVERVKPIRKLPKEQLLQLYRTGATNPRDRALITFTHSTGIARETIVNLTWAHLEDNWETVDTPHIGIPDKLLKGHGRGKWKGVEQHTFLTLEAKKDLIDYRNWWQRRTHIKFKKTDHIFWNVNVPIQPLDYVTLGFQALKMARRSGVPFSWHDARRWVETALEEATLHPNWCRKIRGRKVRGEEAPYSRPAIEQLRRAYEKAIPYLEFTETKPALTQEQIRKQQVLDTIRLMYPNDTERITKIKNLLAKATTMKEIDEAVKTTGKTPREELEYDKVVSPTTKTTKHTKKEDCQRLITEAELETWLSQGWHVQAVLPSGKIVVSND